MTALDLALVPALYASFDDGTLRLHYQPDVDLRNGSVPGMRAHPRWAHPELGLLGPEAFMPVAAAAGLVGQVHQWVLRMAVTEARTWHRMAAGTAVRPPRLWVRVEGAQLARPEFAAEVERLVLGRSLPPGAVGLQFTEDALAFAAPGLPRLLGRLHALGIAVGVDAFGTWSGSLSTLEALPLNLVRIDGRFLRATIRDLEGQAAFASLVGVAHRRRLVVVAEGVDTARLATAVGRLDCDRVSGPLFCPPVPVEDARLIALGRGRPDRWYKPSADSWTDVGNRSAGRPPGPTPARDPSRPGHDPSRAGHDPSRAGHDPRRARSGCSGRTDRPRATAAG
ncbi:EAL domain-containing protein [Frankia sp. EI5c]|uniref:EAL domain-containing protein n=1 Tax=Frankia sp. EI5c TaxID=683316 RepID=UPI0007C23926|nr:EAL domain-containing protein [Frankia sp. EI5c]OAA24744.1 EAL domain-containing protein [Frankia sp. EI5c]